VRRTLELFDTARIDHFRGLVAYWAVPEGARTARHGHFRRGPGIALFRALERELGSGAPPPAGWTGPSSLPLVGEDLGVITPAVERLRTSLALPGMLVIQFGLDPDEPDSPHRLANHAADRIVYTGTHDQDTIRGWYDGLPATQRAFVDAELVRSAVAEPRRPWWGLIRYAFSSVAEVAMVQAQDVLGLGSEARMNQPGSVGHSWRWQLAPRQLTPALADRLRAAAEESGRFAAGA
jgi:4-alpha-glucanotransferase